MKTKVWIIVEEREVQTVFSNDPSLEVTLVDHDWGNLNEDGKKENDRILLEMNNEEMLSERPIQ